ncbi:MAG: ATP-dependent DNA helicase [Clostridia bacterium]|nr:ATP-dependent DNA helicase [Clostridia bacterium]MBQ7339171.1 ATP-dependent DNA helicase [Clostridia bacterium]
MRYHVERACVEMSVRELCETALSSGDLEYGGGRAMFAAMQTGTQWHQKLQKGRGAGYRAEVPLHHTTLYEGIAYEVHGRADGIEQDGQGYYIVEEIKSVGNYRFYQPVMPVHMAQLRVYAHFLCCEKALDGVRVRLVRVRADDGKIKEDSEYLPAAVLRTYYEQLLSLVARWAQLCVAHAVEELPALTHQKFPYSYMREGQERMIRAAYRTIGKGKRLFAQAPTGIGKTMSALYPAVRALGEGKCDRIFYLTAKASTRREAFDAVRRLVDCGAPLRAVVLTAREQICPMYASLGVGGGRLSSHCNGFECPYAASYYDRAPDAVYELLNGGRGYNRARLLEVAAKYQVCPYELSLDVSEHCDIIIGDYNYVFDPMVYLRRYFMPSAAIGGKSVFLVDEAHNLADRARDMYSAELRCKPLEALCALLDERDARTVDALDGVISLMRGLRVHCRDNLTRDDDGNDRGFYLSRSPLTSLNEKISALYALLDHWLQAHREEDIAPRFAEMLYVLREYLCILEHYDERYLSYVLIEGGEVTVRLFCLDPSYVLDVALARGSAAVLFSATLTPLTYFMDLLGGREGAEHLALSSPYERENLGLFAVESLSTRYEHRALSAEEIARCIAATVSGRRGNYIVYFPSYAYMETVLRAFRARYPRVTAIVQKKGMYAREREEFLDAFQADRGVLRVGFCVLGGSFSEGVDLPGDRLIGSIIVGVGLQGLSNEGNILQEYYQNRCEMGYEYAYLYPGMNRVLQAAGRVIRREEDVGVVVLIDDRYATPAYTQLYPAHWRHLQYAGNAKNLAELVRAFWENHPSDDRAEGQGEKK